MKAMYRFATGRVKVRDIPDDPPPAVIHVRLTDPAGHGRDVDLHRTADWYNGALVYREEGTP